MNYNNYNPYNQYPYNAYQNTNMQPQQNYSYQQPQYQQNQIQQPNHTIFILVNDYNEVERYIVGANQTVNFYDGKNGYVFSKSADGMGKYSIRAFKLEEIDIKDIGKVKVQDTKDYITRSDLKGVQDDFNARLNELSNQIEKLSKNDYKQNYNNNNSKKGSD